MKRVENIQGNNNKKRDKNNDENNSSAVEEKWRSMARKMTVAMRS